MISLDTLKIQIYADGADKTGILDLYAKPYIKGLTTNPSLMKKAGIHNYESFAKEILQTVTAKPSSMGSPVCTGYSTWFPTVSKRNMERPCAGN